MPVDLPLMSKKKIQISDENSKKMPRVRLSLYKLAVYHLFAEEGLRAVQLQKMNLNELT